MELSGRLGSIGDNILCIETNSVRPDEITKLPFTSQGLPYRTTDTREDYLRYVIWDQTKDVYM